MGVDLLRRNLITLYSSRIVRYGLSLLVLAYLARVLQPDGFGRFAFAQAFSLYMIVLIDFGFSLSATREVARVRSAGSDIGMLASTVTIGRVALALVLILAAVLGRGAVPIFRDDPMLLYAALLWAVPQAIQPGWYLEGMERMRPVAALQVGSQLLGAILIVVFVHGPDDAWKAMAARGAGATVAAILAFWLLLSNVRLARPALADLGRRLKAGSSFFVFESAATLYSGGNAFILGLFAPAAFVGYYAGAERVADAYVGLVSPAITALFPRFSHLVISARREAVVLVRRVLVGFLVGGSLFGLTIGILAPIIIRLLLGDGFEESANVLRLLSVVPVLFSISVVLGTLWLAPLGFERELNVVIIIAGAVNLALAALLAGRYRDIGMAAAVLVAEVIEVIGFYIVLRVRRLDPIFQRPSVLGES